MPFNVGENIGPYRIIEQLGQGGMATVFKAYHASLDRYVAIKALHPAFSRDEDFEARFQREARVVARLDHPNIVPIYDYAEHEKRPFLVMKFIEGITLKARIDLGPLMAGEIKKIVEAVGSALAYAHKQGILHRDIKPSNVLVANDGLIYLADFGLARIAQAGESTLSSDMVMGTPQYISPEQAMGKKDLDQRTDLYSFGVMLYEMLVGKVPFSADTPFSIIHDHIYSPLPLPHTVNPHVPEAMERFLLKALAKEREDRFEDADQFVAAFMDAWERSNEAITQMIQPEDETVIQPPRAPVQAEPTRIPTAQGSVQKSQTGPAPAKKRSPLVFGGVVLILVLCLASLGIARNNRLFARLLGGSQRAATATAIPLASPSAASPTHGQPLTFTAIASQHEAGKPPANVLDGDFESIWSAGADPIQWIQIDLGRPATVSKITLTVAQYPAGRTVHKIMGGSAMRDLVLLHEFTGNTAEQDELVYEPSDPVADIRFIRVITTQSPSWVAWREIEVELAPAP